MIRNPGPFADMDPDPGCGSTRLSDLEEVIGLRGWLRRHAHVNRNANMSLLLVNEQYGTNFQLYRDAITFMDGVVEAAKQRARDRAAALRVLA